MTQAIWAVLIMIAIQQLDNHVITPLVQRTRSTSPSGHRPRPDHRWRRWPVFSVFGGGSDDRCYPGSSWAIWRTRVLGETWGEASQHMIEYTEPPERIAGIDADNPTRAGCSTPRASSLGNDEAGDPRPVGSDVAEVGRPHLQVGQQGLGGVMGRSCRSGAHNPGRRSTGPCLRSARRRTR